MRSYCDRRIWIAVDENGWLSTKQYWSTKDEIETSIRTFQSVGDKIENTFSKIEWRGDENEWEILY